MAAELMTWDWKEQLDLDELSVTVDRLSGGRLHVHQVETGSDQFAIVLTDEILSTEQVDEIYEKRWRS